MSRLKICHRQPQRVSGDSPVLPPKKQPETFLFFTKVLIIKQNDSQQADYPICSLRI